MPDENLEKEKAQNELYKMKAEALDVHALLDKLTAQGNQLAAAYNKMVETIQMKEKLMKKEKEPDVNSDNLPKP